MADRLSVEQRSLLMGRIRGKDTKPEMLVRRYLHGKGFRFRIHDRRLPGSPDIVLPKYRTVISQRNEGSGTITIGPLLSESRKRMGRYPVPWGGRGGKASWVQGLP